MKIVVGEDGCRKYKRRKCGVSESVSEWANEREMSVKCWS